MRDVRRLTDFPVSLYVTPSALHSEIFYTVLRAGHLRAAAGYGVKRDHFPGYELIYCLRGNAFVKVAGVRHEVSEGDLVLFNCHHPHEHGTGEQDPWEAYWVRIEGPKLERMCSILSVEQAPVVSGIAENAVIACYQTIFKLLQLGEGEAAPLVHAEVARLLALACCARQFPADEHGPAPLRPVIDLMRSAYFEPHRVEDLAALAGMSAPHFTRLFRRAFGTSPIDWLRRERINQAKRRLGETADPIEWIAGQVGYHDRFFFSKDFKRITGMTPREFRRREQGR
ncbi:MAG: AraC family transcriptional regulator [Bryobacterales bacterium]|nr:AraC family transcriptional regulator [Bryobacterales bacterium]